MPDRLHTSKIEDFSKRDSFPDRTEEECSEMDAVPAIDHPPESQPHLTDLAPSPTTEACDVSPPPLSSWPHSGSLQTLDPGGVRVNLVIENLCSLSRKLIVSGVVAKHMLRPDLWNTCIDRIRLEHLLLNLLINAAHALPNGGTVLFETDNSDLSETGVTPFVPIPAGRYVMIAVTHAGHPYDQQPQPTDFQSQEVPSEAGAPNAHVEALLSDQLRSLNVHLHHENLSAFGGTYRVYLPVPAWSPNTAPSSTPPPRPKRSSPTILLVEDDAAVRELVYSELLAAGYNVLQTADSEAAVDLARTYPRAIDLLLSGIVMPRLNGPTVARAILLHRPHTRVIYMSAHQQASTIAAELSDSPSLFLSNPFTLQALHRILEQALLQPRPLGSILLAEDDPVIRRTIGHLLTNHSYDVHLAQDGRQALRLLSQRHFDVLLTDLVMPDYDGLELIRLVSDRHPATPIVAFSGAGSDLLDLARHLGACATLPKPIHHPALFSILAHLLDVDTNA
jgi:CheY-like chemotaxis protein